MAGVCHPPDNVTVRRTMHPLEKGDPINFRFLSQQPSQGLIEPLITGFFLLKRNNGSTV